MNKPSSNSKTTRALPFFVEFVKFSAGFAGLLALSLLTLKVALAAG